MHSPRPSEPFAIAPLLTRDRVVLLVLTLIGVLLRTLGNDHGLPWITEPDDENVRIALGLAHGITEPSALFESSRYPHLLLYSMWFFDWLFIPVGTPIEDAAATAIQIGRSLSGVLAAVAIVPTFLIARRLGSVRAGHCAAMLMCFELMSVQHGHLAKPHAPLLAFSTFALWFAVEHAIAGRRRDLALAALFACLAAAMIHSGFLAFAGVAVAACVAPRRSGWLRDGLLAALLVCLAIGLAALLGYPNMLSTALRVWSGTAEGAELLGPHNAGGTRSLGLAGFALPAMTLRDYFPFVGAIGLLALPFLAFRGPRRRAFLPLLATSILFFAIFGHIQVYAARFMLPIVPCFVIAAVILLDRLATRVRPRFGTPVMVIAMIGLGGWTAAASCRLAWLYTRADTRELAAQWIDSNVPPTATIASTPYLDMPLLLDAASLAEHRRIVSATTSWTRIQLAQIDSGSDPHASKRRRVWFPFKDIWRAPPAIRMAALREQGVRYGLSLFAQPQLRVDPGFEVFRAFGDIVFSIDPGPSGFTGANLYDIPFPHYWVWIMDRSGPAVEIVQIRELR